MSRNAPLRSASHAAASKAAPALERPQTGTRRRAPIEALEEADTVRVSLGHLAREGRASHLAPRPAASIPTPLMRPVDVRAWFDTVDDDASEGSEPISVRDLVVAVDANDVVEDAASNASNAPTARTATGLVDASDAAPPSSGRPASADLASFIAVLDASERRERRLRGALAVAIGVALGIAVATVGLDVEWRALMGLAAQTR